MGEAEVMGMVMVDVLRPTSQQVELCENKVDHWYDNKRQVNTWIAVDDYQLLIQLAQSSKVRLSVYLRAIITDALEDERERAADLNTNINCKL